MILVAGATGQLGGMIMRRLLERGKEVRMLVRPQSPYVPLVEAGAQPALGDLKDRRSLDPACAGIETARTFGVQLTTLEEFVRRLLSGQG